MFARIVIALWLLTAPFLGANAQFPGARRFAACQCDPIGKPRKPRFLLPVAGIGLLPISLAARDSQLPTLALPSLIDIRGDQTPHTALEGERELAVGALAPDTATVLPTVMVVAAALLVIGAYFLVPRRRGRRRWAGWRNRMARRHGGWRLRSIHRRRLGGAMAALGGILLILGAREYAEGAVAQREARAEWMQMGQMVVRINEPAARSVATSGISALANAESPAELTLRAVPNAMMTSAVPLPVLAMSGREIRRGSPVARLVIPAIAMDEIVIEGVGPVELNGGPGHFPGSVLPGDSGNSIVSAHRDRHFRRLGELGIGSRIRTETRTGSTEWVITERRIVSRDSPSLFEEAEPTLTLTTCWPLRYFGPAPDRLLIIAKPVGARPAN